MTINATAAWLSRSMSRSPTSRARATHLQSTAGRHHQGVSLARHPCVSAGALDAADQGYDPTTTREVPNGSMISAHITCGGGCDAGAGARIRLATAIAVLTHVKASGGAPGLRPVVGRISFSSMPGCASLPKSARCGPSPSCGTNHGHATASMIPSSGCSATACRSTRSGSRNSSQATSPHPHRDAGRDAVEERARAVQLPAERALGLPRPWTNNGPAYAVNPCL